MESARLEGGAGRAGLVSALLWLSWAQAEGELTDKSILMGCAHEPRCPLLLPFYSPSEEEKVRRGAQKALKKQVVYLEAEGQGEPTSISHPQAASR